MGRFKFPVRAVQCNGDTFHVRSITSTQYERAVAHMKGDDVRSEGIQFLRLCVLYGLCDADGNRLMADDATQEVEDMPIITQKVLGEAIIEISGMDQGVNSGN